MKFSPGDKVLMKRTHEEGEVLQLLGNGLLEVRVKGVLFPVFDDEVEHPYLKWFTEKKKRVADVRQPELPKETVVAPRLPKGFFLQFLPKYVAQWDEDLIEHFTVYLLNDTPHTLHTHYHITGEESFNHRTLLRPFQNILLHNISFSALVATPVLLLEIANGEQALRPFHQKLRPKKVHDLIHSMHQQHQPNFVIEIPLLEQEAQMAASEKIVRPRAPFIKGLNELKNSLAHVHHPAFIDLHTQALKIDTRGKTNTEILQQQLQCCRQYVEEAIQHRVSAITIVHGHGKGVLRSSVVALLRSVPQVKKIDHDWDARFGFGATHVYF